MRALLIAMFCTFALGTKAAEQPGDFAYASPLESDGTLPLRRVDLPPWIYQRSYRADLGDLRVFNAAGELVPHALLPRPTPATSSAPAAALPYFPIKASKAGTALDAVDLKIERAATGTITRVISTAAPGKTEPIISAYLVDASGFDQPLAALDLDFREPPGGLTGSVRVESSEDLAHWSTLVSDAPLVVLQFNGQRLERKRVELHAVRHKYLRLSWPSSQPALELTAVRASPGSVLVEPPRTWLAATGMQARPGEFEFDLGGKFPLDRLRIELPQDNAVAPARLLSRPEATGEWRLVASTVLYRLRQGDQLVTQPDLAIGVTHHRYWLLRVDQQGGGVGQGTVTLRAGWVPQTLVFAARGNDPFQLAYGSAHALPSAYPIESLVPGYRNDVPLQASTARALEPRTLKGASALRPTRDVKAWSLWSVLVLSVLLLGWMAWRLARQLRNAPEQR